MVLKLLDQIKMIEVIISQDELKGLQHQAEYIKNKLRKAGVPVTGFFSLNSQVRSGMLTKYSLGEGLIKFVWSE